jgi:hypothetical protein
VARYGVFVIGAFYGTFKAVQYERIEAKLAEEAKKSHGAKAVGEPLFCIQIILHCLTVISL